MITHNFNMVIFHYEIVASFHFAELVLGLEIKSVIVRFQF